MRGKELARMISAHGLKAVSNLVQESIGDFMEGKTGAINPGEINFRDLFLAVTPDGHELMECWRREEAVEASAVQTSAFTAISKTIVGGLVRSAYANPAFTATGLIPAEQSSNPNPEIMPEIAPLGDTSQEVGEGQEYPVIGMSENWTERPLMKKRGNMIFMTKEVITRDQTGVIREEARQLGYWLGLNRELRLLDLIIGFTNTYKRNDVPYNTYQTSSPWINDHSNPMSDWNDIDESKSLFSDMRHPDTGLPIMLETERILVPDDKRFSLSRILTATTIETLSDGGNTRTLGGNPVSGYSGTTSQLLDYQIAARGLATAGNAKNWWFHGDFAKAFGYAEIYPLQMEQASDAAIAVMAFTRDIIAGFAAKEKGVAYVKEPRHVVRNKN